MKTEKIDPAATILTSEAVEFVRLLNDTFNERRLELLRRRIVRQKVVDAQGPEYFSDPQPVEGDWVVARIPDDLKRRHVEITGPASDRKMVINGLNSGADVYMSDFEDSLSPTRDNIINGHFNLKLAVDGDIDFQAPNNKFYKLNENVATLMVRPRGLHLDEVGFIYDSQPSSASLLDFGLFFYHNAKSLIKKGSGPYFYLPKLEGPEEARWWRDVFNFSESHLGIQQGSIRATVLIETVWAAFQMDQILFELSDYSAGLNCGRWDYIFSFIKCFRNWPSFTLPDRSQVTMDKGFLRAYADLLIQTCHRRKAHAMGGMAAQIPIKHDPAANELALSAVRQDKLREVYAGHDGTWVAHPGLVSIARDEMSHIPGNRNPTTPTRTVTKDDLLEVPLGTITKEGLRNNVVVGLRYLDAWLKGQGCVPINNLMEDAATAEICRSQLWQWVKHKAKLECGCTITPSMVREIIDTEDPGGDCEGARELLGGLVENEYFVLFLTLSAIKGLRSQDNHPK